MITLILTWLKTTFIKPFNLFIAFIIVILVAYGVDMHYSNKSLKADLVEAKATITSVKNANKQLTSTISTQNESIAKLEADSKKVANSLAVAKKTNLKLQAKAKQYAVAISQLKITSCEDAMSVLRQQAKELSK